MNTATLRRLLGETTPRPWGWAHIYDGENIIQGEPSEHVAIVETAADIALIVELVNNADELLAENERLRAFAASIFTTDDWDYDDWCRKARKALEQNP